MTGIEGIGVEPSPAKEGGEVTITGDPDSQVFIGYKGKIVAKKLDSRGKITIDVPVEAGEEFTVSDGGKPPSNKIVKVYSTMK